MSAVPRWPALLLLALTAPTVAKTKPCTTANAAAAEEAADDAHKSWAKLNAQYRKYAWAMDCDGGAIAEGWDDAVARLLASSWDELPALARLVAADPEFLPFVIRHISATAATHDLEKARANAATRCPAGQDELCRLIADGSAAALAEPGCSFASPPKDEADAQRRIAVLAPANVHWSSVLRVSLVGKAVPDFVMLGVAPAEAVVGVALGTACDVKSVFRFKNDRSSKDGLCGDPAAARIVSERLPSKNDADAPLGARGRADARRRAFRLESGDCDAIHFYFDGHAVRWWRR